MGDTALSSISAKRTATIISLTESHFGCLKKEIYSSIKESREKEKKNLINYIYNIKIFNNMIYKALETKYFNYFAFKDASKKEFILRKDEINNNLIIVKNGSFEITYKGSLKDILQLINYYNKNYKEYFTNLEMKKLKLNDCITKKVNKLNNNIRKIKNLFGHENHIIEEYKLFHLNKTSILGLKETERKNDKDEFLSFFDIKCTSIEGEYILLDKKIFYKQIYGLDYKVKEETKFYLKEFTEKTINRFIHILYSKIWAILSKNNMEIFKSIKKLSYIENESKKNNIMSKNLINEIGFDYNYMEKNNLTDIEYIIDKIFDKFKEGAFDYKNKNSYLNKFFEKREKEIIQKNNNIKLEDEKYDLSKIKLLFKDLKEKKKIHLAHYKSAENFLEKSEIPKKIKIPKLNLNLNNNNDKGKRKITLKNRKNPFFPNTIKYKLRKSNSHFFDEKRNILSTNSVKITRKYSLKKISFDNNNQLRKKYSSSLSKARTIDSFQSDIVNITCNYINYNNAHISNIWYIFKKDELMNDYNTLNIENENKYKFRNLISPVVNPLMNRNDNLKKKFRCCSVKNFNSSNKIILDTSQKKKNYFIEKRKKYVLKTTRNLFTKNNNYVLYKRLKK